MTTTDPNYAERTIQEARRTCIALAAAADRNDLPEAQRREIQAATDHLAKLNDQLLDLAATIEQAIEDADYVLGEIHEDDVMASIAAEERRIAEALA